MATSGELDAVLPLRAFPARGVFASGRTRVWRFIRRKPLGAIGAAIILVFLLVSALADIIAPYPYGKIHPRDRLAGPSSRYRLGTDDLGRDLFSRIVYGGRI